MRSVIPFPRQVQRRCCASCAIPLPRLAPAWHTLCKPCFLHTRHYHIVRRIVAEGRR